MFIGIRLKMVTFSIIIPIYNAAKTLAICLDSCVKQTYTYIEIICVDDYSSDRSREILQTIQNSDSRIKFFFHEKNKGTYMARYTGVIHATGDYILFLDSDDSLRHDACILLAENIEKNHSDIIQFGYMEIPNRNKVFSPFYHTVYERIDAYLAKENRLSPELWTKAYSYQIIKKAYSVMECFHAFIAEDLYTSIVITYYAASFSFLRKALVYYSVNTGISGRKEYNLQTYTAWLSSYNTVIQKTKMFIAQYIPEFTEKCFDMELYLLKDFLSNRIAPNISSELKYQLFDILPAYFSKNVIYTLIEESLFKAREYDTYFNFNGSFKSKSKKMIKIFLLYLKSLDLFTNHRNDKLKV